MARFTVENLGMVDGQAIVDELQAWQDELTDNNIEDAIVYATLDTVIDIVVNA